MHSFDLKQVVTAPTHANGHILDLVLCYGLSGNYTVVYDTNFSDLKKTVIFKVSVPIETCISLPMVCKFHRIDYMAHTDFITAFDDASMSATLNSPLHLLNSEGHLTIFV